MGSLAYLIKISIYLLTRWGRPVDNRPSNGKLQTIVQKREEERRRRKKRKKLRHVTCDMLHIKFDMWFVVVGEHALQIAAPYLLPLVDWEEKGH